MAGKDALMIDGERGVGRLVVREGAERNELAGIRRNVNGLETHPGSAANSGSDFHHHVILIQTFVDVGDLALAEGVAQGCCRCPARRRRDGRRCRDR